MEIIEAYVNITRDELLSHGIKDAILDKLSHDIAKELASKLILPSPDFSRVNGPSYDDPYGRGLVQYRIKLEYRQLSR